MTKPPVIVFLGPSLSSRHAKIILDADYRGPAAQGDIFRACDDRPKAIGLIDGVFKDQPTVRHREILWALSKGIPVFGAASMGALRAAELSADGMIGVGLIYRWYRRFALLPDDAVAVTHGPAALGSPPLSDALIDIRMSAKAAVRQGQLGSERAISILRDITAQPFEERRLPDNLKSVHVSQKGRDAKSLLQLLANHKKTGNWPEVGTTAPPIVHAWLDDLRDSGLDINHLVNVNRI